MENGEVGEEGLQTPLLSQGNVVKGFNKDEIFAELKKQLTLAGPLVSVNLLLSCIQMISVMFVGHLGELPLAGASMATSFAGVTGYSLMIGMGSALDTFCGQSYGAKQYHLLGIHMQRAMLVLLMASIPLACIWANAGYILEALGQDPEISAEAGIFARFMIPSIFAYALLQCHVRFLQTQNNVVPMMISTGITTSLHVLICWIMVYKSGLGSRGAALANAISYWINVLLLAVYVRISPSCKKTWTGFSKEAFHGVPNFLRLAVPSAVMVCLEIWSFEMMVLLSGLLPNPKLETSVLSISLNTCSLVYMIPLGLSGATSIRVSNELGAGRPIAARFALRVAVSLVSIEGTLAAATMILGRRLWGYCYSREEEVVSYVAEMLLLIAGSHFLDGIQSILSGAVRGCGRQKIGAIVNLGAYYLIGMPTAILLAFIFHLGGKNRPSSGFNSPYFTTNSGAPVWNNNSSLTVGTRDYRHMEGSSVNTYSLINKAGKAHLVKFHWKPTCGVKCLSDEEAIRVGGSNHSHATQDLYDSIAAGNFPEWKLFVQIIDTDHEDRFDFYPLDVTKTWPEDIIPLQPVGRMVLNKNIDNFFAENEQLAFCPAIIVRGYSSKHL